MNLARPVLHLAWLLAVAGPSVACRQTDLVAFDSPEPACASGAGCSAADACAARSCETVLTPAERCAARSSLLAIGDGCAAELPGIQSFRYALCSCSDLVTNAALRVDGPASTALAVNGALRVADTVRIEGSVQVGAALSASGQTAPTITGKLSEHAPSACACDETQLFDVGAAVAARERDNDNASLKLAATALDGFSSARELDLDCGRYYLSRIAGSSALQLRVHGRVAVFVAGNVELDAGWSVSLDRGAQLNLFIAGNVRVGGRLEMTTPDTADRLLVLVGGHGTIDLGADATLVAALYAPRAELVTRGRFEITGAMFVRRAAPGADLIVHYAASTGDAAASGCGAR